MFPACRDEGHPDQWRVLLPNGHRFGSGQCQPSADIRTFSLGDDVMIRCVLITGATGGIGGALAVSYAEPGKTLILQGRNVDRVAELEAICTARGARVLTRALDIRDREALNAWLVELSTQEAPDLVIVNAGVNANIGSQGQGEHWADIEALVQVNVMAVMATG